MSEFEGMVDYIQSTINDLANINLIRQGKRRKIVTGEYVLFDKHYYYETYGIEGNDNDIDVSGNSDRDCVGVGTVDKNE